MRYGIAFGRESEKRSTNELGAWEYRQD